MLQQRVCTQARAELGRGVFQGALCQLQPLDGASSMPAAGKQCPAS
jgi:hypothetical protein